MMDLISYTFKDKYIVWYFDAYFSKILDGFLLVCDAGLLPIKYLQPSQLQ